MRKAHPRSRGAGLPAAGHERDEELRKRQDALEEEIDLRSQHLETGGGKKVYIENEIASSFNRFNMLEVSDREPGYEYLWCWRGTPHTQSLQLGLCLADGWEVVQGDMKEAREKKGIGGDTTRQVGDVILLRIRKDRFIGLSKYYRTRRLAMEGSVTANIEQLAMEQNRKGRGVIIKTDVNDPLVEMAMKRATARDLAGRKLDTQIREGTAHLPQ